MDRILAMMEEAPGKQGQCFCKQVGVVTIQLVVKHIFFILSGIPGGGYKGKQGWTQVADYVEN